MSLTPSNASASVSATLPILRASRVPLPVPAVSHAVCVAQCVKRAARSARALRARSARATCARTACASRALAPGLGAGTRAGL
eukprot:5966306-Pleurochrysis_carterae.AAC.1